MTLVPDLAVPVAGWRAWDVIDLGRGPELVSPVRPLPWKHRVPTTATCASGCRPCPSSGCTCGLYATAGLGPLLPLVLRGAAVLGCAALWGQVVEHSHGWRGEQSYPLVLFVLTARPGGAVARVRSRRRRGTGAEPLPEEDFGGVEALARELARSYAVPVHPAPRGIAVAERGGAAAAADALRTEAGEGLAGRRFGDPGADERLARRVRDLLGATGL